MLPLLLLLLGDVAPPDPRGGTGEEEEVGGGRMEGGGGEDGCVTRYIAAGNGSGLNFRPRLLAGGDDLWRLEEQMRGVRGHVAWFHTGMDSRPGLKKEPSAALGILGSNVSDGGLSPSPSPLDLQQRRQIRSPLSTPLWMSVCMYVQRYVYRGIY